MAEQRLVALGDILGFKNTILTTPLERVINEYFAFFRKAMQHSLQLESWPETPEDFDVVAARAGIGMQWFSDTIIWYTLRDDDESVRLLISAIAWLSFETMFSPAVRLRFGIDYGELHVSRNAGQLVGDAIVGAASLEKAPQWAGGALTPRAFERLAEDARFYTVEYAVPVKPGFDAPTNALNWAQGVHLAFKVPFSPTKREPEDSDPPAIVEKWRNTLAFHNRVCPTHGKPPARE